MEAASLPATELGERLRAARLAAQAAHGARFSLRAVAARIGVSATYLSLLERGVQRPTEATLRTLADDLSLDLEPLLPLAGRIAEDVVATLRARPRLADLVRALRDRPDEEIDRTIRRIRDGDW